MTTGVIAQTNLTVTAAANTKTYDGTTGAASAPTITAGSIQAGDTAPSWTETYASRNVGTGKTLTPAALTVADGNNGLNYSYTYAPVTTGEIDPTNLTVTAAVNSKTYDGTTSAAATPTITAGSLQSGDTQTAFTETYADRNVGTGKTLTPAGQVLDGNSGLNYSYAYTAVTTGVIAQTNLTVTAAANSKTYDGTTSAAATPTITAGSLQSGDTQTAFTETYADRKAGTGKTLTPAGQVLDGNSGLNYSYTYTAVATGVIAQTNLTVTAAANTKSYDGTTSAAAAPTITAGSIQAGDTAPAWTETYTSANAGTGLTLTPAALTVSDGNGGANYSYTYTPVSTGEIDPLGTTTLLAANINPAGLTTNVTFTATVSGVLPAATLPTGNVIFSANGTPFATNGLPTGSGSITASTASLPAGTDPITAQYLGDGNFQASVSSLLSEVVTNNVIYSQTNVVASVVNQHNGSYTLNLVGTPGAQYYVVACTNVNVLMANWTAVVGSTNTASVTDGTWSCVVSNAAPAFYRSEAVSPAP